MLQTSVENKQKVHMISLGCARNRVDSEVMLGSLLRGNWEISDHPDGSDAVIINTCGFIQSAKEESIDQILQAAELKKSRPGMKVVVAGCLTQRYKSQLSRGLPEVDLFIGTDEFPRLPELLASDLPPGSVFAKRTHYLYNESMPRVNTLAKHSAYVKVAEGCQHNCAFCIIPAIRGRLRSRPLASVVAEVKQLAQEGVKEINLIAQDLAAYGRDRKEEGLLPMLRALAAIDGIEWIRCLYMYPENISDEFMEFMATEPKIVKYLDVPVQHGSDRILSQMNRGVTRAQLSEVFARLRDRVPGIAIRTSVMVGFPGETEEDFEQLRSFVAEQRFDHLGCFSYSQEEGTVAGRMKDQIDEETKARRLDEVMKLQKEISWRNLRKYVGQEVFVLTEGPSDESDLLWQGRMSVQAPEVDGVVLINDGPVRKGQIQRVRISDAFEYDLVGEVMEESEDLGASSTTLGSESGDCPVQH
jgi:ribosomal protein S12 methylthiotransferase